MKMLYLKVADICFQFLYNGTHLILDTEKSVGKYIVSQELEKADYQVKFSVTPKFTLDNYSLVFKGEPEQNSYLNYYWEVYKKEDKIALKVDFRDYPSIEGVVAFLSPISNLIDIQVKAAHSGVISIDPFLHPLGSLILLYVMNWNNGLLIHASGVKLKGNSYLFTGVSGVGKSTMANIWKSQGAVVLNDDRLIIRFVNNEVKLYNNPMPYYAQNPEQGSLKGIFLLRQSKVNYVTQLKGVKAYSGVLGNFIQQFYQKKIVAKHLDLVEKLVQNIPVYEVGFMPDKRIVEMITKM